MKRLFVASALALTAAGIGTTVVHARDTNPPPVVTATPTLPASRPPATPVPVVTPGPCGRCP